MATNAEETVGRVDCASSGRPHADGELHTEKARSGKGINPERVKANTTAHRLAQHVYLNNFIAQRCYVSPSTYTIFIAVDALHKCFHIATGI